jgi:Putative Na+/H+ antiporter
MNQIDLIGSAFFAIAVLHTFSIKVFEHLAFQFRHGSVGRNLFHLLGEVEIIFGFWAGALILVMLFIQGSETAIQFIERTDFTEALFVFAIMTVAATRPVIRFASQLIRFCSKFFFFLPSESAYYAAALSLGPLLGSFITEPAAMTVTAFILRDRFYEVIKTEKFKYVTLGTLFVNVSIGGVLTHFAAPPILMVAKTWNWNTSFVFSQLGWKAALAVIINTGLAVGINFQALRHMSLKTQIKRKPLPRVPAWLILLHLFTLALIVLTSHHSQVFLGILLFFLGIVTITQEYQDELKLRQSLLVAFFLGGLVILGNFQRWWLEPLIGSLDSFSLFLGTTALTAITDNAALTYLGSQVPHVSDQFKYALVAGAVAGGGLTVIANAPNPIGFSILRDAFGEEGINPLKLLGAALGPTLIAMVLLWTLY